MKQMYSVATAAWWLFATTCSGTSLAADKHAHIAVQLENRQGRIRISPTAAVCTEAKCESYAKYIKASLAPNYTAIDPCVDFDKYACDGFRATHQYRPDQATLSVTTVMSDANRDILRAILEGQYADNTTFTGADRNFDQVNFKKLKTAYETCKDEKSIKEYGTAPLRKILAEFESLYPVSGPAVPAKTANEDLTEVVTWLFNNSVYGLVSASVGADDMNPDTQIISLGASEIQLTKQFYNKSIILANYTRAIADMLYVISSGKPITDEPIPLAKNASLYEKAQRVVGFEKAVAQRLADPEKQNEIGYYYNLKTLTEVDTMVPEISVRKYLEKVTPKGYGINSNLSVVASDINYFRNLSNLIQTTSRETLHDYFEWRIISTWSGRIHNNLTIPLRRFANMMAGRDPDAIAERWRTCIQEVDMGLGHLLGATFIQRAFSKKDKHLGDQIIDDIKKVFGANLNSLDWMTDSAKQVAAQKVLNIMQKVGYQTKNPNEESPQELFEYYSRLPITHNYFDNGLAFSAFGRNTSWYQLLKPTDRERWEMTSPTVNAYFMPPLNVIVFPAGIMQTPNFSGDLPEYVSYGAFGATAGHELTHGFDDNGAKYDASGRYREWWDDATTARFDNKTQCFIKQYSQFSIEGLEGEKVPINGKLTLGENIADSGGLNAAYRAWKNRQAAASTPNPGLPGLEQFTNDQMFFISYANSWCEKVRKEALVQQVYGDPHSPADMRTLGSVANSPDFRKVFNCPAKKATCELW